MDNLTNEIVTAHVEDTLMLNRLIVTAYATNNRMAVGGGFLKSYIIDASDERYADVAKMRGVMDIEDVIRVFEQVVPSSEKVTNGAVYTPRYIREYVVAHVLATVKKPHADCLCADIACGCGAFLYTLAEKIMESTDERTSDVISRLYGLDISQTSVERTKILLALLALKHGEDIYESVLHVRQGNTLTFNFMEDVTVSANSGFDIIVGNPPYVRAKNIDAKVKRSMSAWRVSKTGNPDLYIPFFEIGKSLLTNGGQLGFITVNSFFKSVNARSLREYFQKSRTPITIIDFGQHLVFSKKLAYTCIVFIAKDRADAISYSKCNPKDIETGKEPSNFNVIRYALLNCHRGWSLGQETVVDNIRRIEQAGTPLGDKYVIKNGIATLANSVFIFRPRHTDARYHYLIKDGTEYPIEIGICRDIIKPNVLKSEEDIREKEEKIISPYDAKGNLMGENAFKEHFPMAYKYLSSQRATLDKRDKGSGDYGEWFAFGRTQAIADKGKKLLFPYMSDVPHFVYTPQSDMMIYCGYAIYNESEEELLFLKRILESDVFCYYIRNTSKPYSSGYYSYAKNYVKSFGMYPFTPKEKKDILAMKDIKELNRFILSKYNVIV